MNLPAAFLDRLRSIVPVGDRYTSARAVKFFRVNTLKAAPSDIHQTLTALGVACEPVEWYPAAFAVPAPQSQIVLNSDLVRGGQVYAQGLESMLAVHVLDPKPGETVLDLCAAPGSKTSQIAAHMSNTGELVANEPIKDRFYRLKGVLDLLGAKASVKMTDGRYLRMAAQFDRVLVDAPCSSEGRFLLEHPKTYAYWSLRKINEMAHKQKGLLLNASRLVKPGGVLVYATCTFAPEENEAVVDWFLKKSEGRFKVVPLNVPYVPQYPALMSFQGKDFDPRVAGALRVLPGDRMEGFFITKFVCS